MKIRELASAFQEMEVQHRLFEFRSRDGIYCWDLFRYTVYMTVLSKHGIYQNIRPYLQPAPEPRWKRLAKVARALLPALRDRLTLRRSAHAHPQYAFLVISRFQDESGRPVDLVFRDLLELCGNDVFLIELFRHPAFRRQRASAQGRYFLHELDMRHLLSSPAREDWRALIEVVEARFPLGVDWQPFLDATLHKYRVDRAFYRGLFERVRPRVLFYQSEPKGMVAAANQAGVITVDLQHGHTNDVDMMYHYPEVPLDHVESIPHTMLTLGPRWNQLFRFPRPRIPVGNSYFYLPTDPDAMKRNGFLIVSSRFAHEYLVDQTFQLARAHPEIRFIYKLHSNQAEHLAPSRALFSELSNVEVVYTERGVNDILPECFAIGLIQSTVLYQAIQAGLKVFIFATDYYEASYDAFEESSVVVVDSYEQISGRLADPAFRSEPGRATRYFEPFQPDLLAPLMGRKD